MNNIVETSDNAVCDDDKQLIVQPSRKLAFLEDLLTSVDDPSHKKILGAYKQDDPIASMEAELSRILLEIVGP
jgi:hypothetical protein